MIGSVVAIYVAATGAAPMQPVPRAELERGRGIRGDRYYARAGTFSKPAITKADQEITLIESEEIDAFSRSAGLALDYGTTRRNVVTREVRLNDLVNVRFSVGAALLEGIRLCEPCAHLAALVSEKVLPGLVHRAGLRARILRGGVVVPGDSVAVSAEAGTAEMQTENLTLVLQTPEEVRARLAAMPPATLAEVSPDWLEQLDASTAPDPWVHGFAMIRRDGGGVVGHCGFKGAPRNGMVEIAYGVDSDQQSKGFATEAAAALVEFAFRFSEVDVVRAHTLPEAGPSPRLLAKCGFEHVGDVIDPDDGLVWRFEKRRK